MGVNIPVIESTYYMDFPGMGCPDRKKDALLPVLCTGMSAQLLINIIMCALAENVLIRFGDENSLLLQGMHCLILLLRCHNVTLHRSNNRKTPGDIPEVLFYHKTAKKESLTCPGNPFPAI